MKKDMTEDLEKIFTYFPELTKIQQQQLRLLGPTYVDLNAKINVISRKDIESLYLKHVLHSLSIARFINFKPNAKVLDLGTGGGFPGIPLAILFPETNFLLIDGTSKKIKVVNEVKEILGLENVAGLHKRAEDLKMKFDFVLARAVTRLEQLYLWSIKLMDDENRHARPNGLITLKGGDLTEEIKEVSKNNYVEQKIISDFFSEDFFETKSIVYVQV